MREKEKRTEKTSNYRALCGCHFSLALPAFWRSPLLRVGWVIICFEVTLTVISPAGCASWGHGEWLTSAELEKQQVPHLEYGSQTPPPPDRRKTWHRRRSFPRPARTGREGGSRQMRQTHASSIKEQESLFSQTQLPHSSNTQTWTLCFAL